MRSKRKRTTISDKATQCMLDKVNLQLVANRPNRLRVPDFTCAPAFSCLAYASLVIDVCAPSLIEVLQRPLESAHDVFIKCIARPQHVGIEPSVGSVGDSFDNALAESIFGLFKTETITRLGAWLKISAAEYATLGWVGWFNNRRLLKPLSGIPPAVAKERYGHQLDALPIAAWHLT